MRLPPVLKFSKGVNYLPVLDPSLQGTGRSEKKRTPGLIFGSPAAGTPARRGGALARRPATAGPPGATPKPISACFMRRGYFFWRAYLPTENTLNGRRPRLVHGPRAGPAPRPRAHLRGSESDLLVVSSESCGLASRAVSESRPSCPMLRCKSQLHRSSTAA